MSLAAAVSPWLRIPVTKIEDLKDVVLGADFEAVQMSKGQITGSLAFSTANDLMFSSGWVDGRFGLKGPLSKDQVTLGLGLHLPAGTKHWLAEVETGSTGIFLPGEDHDSLYNPGSLYAAVSLSMERLEARAALMGKVLDMNLIKCSGISKRLVPRQTTKLLRDHIALVHHGNPNPALTPADYGNALLDALIGHYVREPELHHSIPGHGHARIVKRARDYIDENLEQPLTVEVIATAAATSYRSLYRAFSEILDETPQSYVQKLRLHRIRHELASEKEVRCTVTTIANRWGMAELGRFSGVYRQYFGELPSATLQRSAAAAPEPVMA